VGNRIGIGFDCTRKDAGKIFAQIGTTLAAVQSGAELTDQQIDTLFAADYASAEKRAKSLPVYEKVRPARQFVLIDLVFTGFDPSPIAALLGQAVRAETLGATGKAAALYAEAARAVQSLGERAACNAEYLRTGTFE
jgi:hypothetical protein